MYGVIETINVVCSDDKGVFKVVSFRNDEEGKRLAKIHFYDIVKDLDDQLVEEEIEGYVTKGMYDGIFGVNVNLIESYKKC